MGIRKTSILILIVAYAVLSCLAFSTLPIPHQSMTVFHFALNVIFASVLLFYALRLFQLKQQAEASSLNLAAASDAIKRQNTRTQGILDATPDAFILLDTNGRFLEANSAYCRMTGYTRDELLHMHIWDLSLRDSSQEKVKLRIEQIIRDQGAAFESQHRCRDGRIIDFDVIISFVPVDPNIIFSFMRDITEKKKRDLEFRERGDLLQAAQEQLQSIVENVHGFICTIDLNYRFLYVNRVARGYNMEQILGSSILDYYTPEYRGIARQVFDEAIATGEPREFRSIAYGDFQKPVWFFSRLGPIQREGKVVSLTVIAQEISEMVQQEQVILESLKEKEILLREIQHRVKNNLQLISSLLNLQKMRTPDAVVQRAFEDARNRIQSMALIHTMLYETGSLSQVPMSPYIETLTHRLVHSHGIAQPGVEIVCDVEALSLNITQAIPCALIINELVSNALCHAFTEGPGRITVRLKNTGREVLLAVEDNGCGLPESAGSGTVGLQLVRMLAGQLGATLNTTVSGGTRWELKIPGN